jgi:tRNA (cmo5U34)-methyltransferase
METKHQSSEHDHPATAHGHGHGHDQQWSDETFVANWLLRQEVQLAAMRPQFAKIRALIPRGLGETFRYVDLAAGAGHLDELILDRFAGAQATLIDSSAPLLAHAQQRLARFAGRVQYVQTDLSHQGWIEQISGPFDAAVAARAVHHLGDSERIQAFFAEVRQALAPGGVFINLDYVRLSHPDFQALGTLAGQDPDAQFDLATPAMQLPCSIEEQLAWLREAGFAAAECVYREFQMAVVVGVRDQIRWPAETAQQ